MTNEKCRFCKKGAMFHMINLTKETNDKLEAVASFQVCNNCGRVSIIPYNKRSKP